MNEQTMNFSFEYGWYDDITYIIILDGNRGIQDSFLNFIRKPTLYPSTNQIHWRVEEQTHNSLTISTDDLVHSQTVENLIQKFKRSISKVTLQP